jgi:deoxyhypusine synthase
MARPRLCKYCERPDCNDRCSRTELRHRIDKLLELTDELEKGELEMQKELDALAAEKNELVKKLGERLSLGHWTTRELAREVANREGYFDEPT